MKLKDLEGQNYEIPDVFKSLDREEGLRKHLKLETNAQVLLYRVVGILTYLNVMQHTWKIGKTLKQGDLVIISFRYVTLADHDGLQLMINFVEETEKTGVIVILAGVKTHLRSKIKRVPQLGEEFKKRSWNQILTEF